LGKGALKYVHVVMFYASANKKPMFMSLRVRFSTPTIRRDIPYLNFTLTTEVT